MPSGAPSEADRRFLERAVALALEAERRGNLPVGAVVTLDEKVIAEAGAATFAPARHPGRHAEVRALAAIPERLIPRLGEMTCYTTLEPCIMCFGALLLHAVGRVVYGADDPRGGAVALLAHLPPYVAAKAQSMSWEGPAWPEVCDPLARRTLARHWGPHGSSDG